MANRLRVTEIDFDTIKQNLKTFLNQQSEFTDYDFEGSGLSVLLDILAYNTHYQAYYLNMVANEAFMDTALLRDSVTSHSKVLGYTPHSRSAPKALINFTVSASSNADASLTIPKGYNFLSETVDQISYNFVTLEEHTVTKANLKYSFSNLPIYQGELVTYNFSYVEASNPKQVFTLPDNSIDTTTIQVIVQPSTTNTSISTYTFAPDASETTTESEVFYLQEGKGGRYDIYFGDDVIGKRIADGSTVIVTYLTTGGSNANKANNFFAMSTLVDSLGSLQGTFVIDPVKAAAGGSERESVDSIKFSAPLGFATQNRLVTFKDYANYIMKVYPAIDSVSVWGGEDEAPPTYGRVYVALKPKPNYFLSDTEKQSIVDNIIKPKSVVTVQTIIRDAEYLYLLISPTVTYDPTKTTLSNPQLKTSIRNSIIGYKNTYLDKFESRFILSKMQEDIDNIDNNAILGSKISVKVQKRFTPSLSTSTAYNIRFNVPLRRGTIGNKLTSTFFTVVDSQGVNREVQFDEIPQSFSGVSSINVTSPGQGFTSEPTVTIEGDGVGASAKAIIVNKKIQRIEIINRGIDYTRATVTISGGGGYGASATAVVDGRIGTIRTVYYDTFAQRQVVDENAGEIDYDSGIVTISNIRILAVQSVDGDIRLSIESEKGIISTTKNTIVTIDEDDPTAVSTTLETV